MLRLGSRPRAVALLAALGLVAASAGASADLAGARGNARAVLARALSRSLASSQGADGALVRDLTTGRTLFSSASGTPRLPASVEKIYTTATALLRLGPNATLTTSILGDGQTGADGVWRGTLYLRGGGDPTFGSASYDNYAYGTGATMQQLVSGLVSQTAMTAFQGRIVGDESVFDSVRGTPATGNSLSGDVEGELSGLAYDRGFADEQGTAFQAHPAQFAAQQLESALRAAGVDVMKGTRVGSGVTSPTAAPIASVSSPRLRTLIQLTNSPSDNFLAEMLLKQLGARFGGAGTSAAGAAVVTDELAHAFGIHPQLNDGSGLSRADLTSPRDVVTALTDLATNRPFVRSLSVAGVTGTMQTGLAGTYAQGRCRGKTGTLHDVANLVGFCTARDGHVLVFAFLMNQVDPAYGHSLEDRMAVAVARYSG